MKLIEGSPVASSPEGEEKRAAAAAADAVPRLDPTPSKANAEFGKALRGALDKKAAVAAASEKLYCDGYFVDDPLAHEYPLVAFTKQQGSFYVTFERADGTRLARLRWNGGSEFESDVMEWVQGALLVEGSTRFHLHASGHLRSSSVAVFRVASMRDGKRKVVFLAFTQEREFGIYHFKAKQFRWIATWAKAPPPSAAEPAPLKRARVG